MHARVVYGIKFWFPYLPIVDLQRVKLIGVLHKGLHVTPHVACLLLVQFFKHCYGFSADPPKVLH